MFFEPAAFNSSESVFQLLEKEINFHIFPELIQESWRTPRPAKQMHVSEYPYLILSVVVRQVIYGAVTSWTATLLTGTFWRGEILTGTFWQQHFCDILTWYSCSRIKVQGRRNIGSIYKRVWVFTFRKHIARWIR